ncbi:hypothetical protein TNCV_4693951 [Trichonephila clavipes]|uniref:Uncharacterized protein n=1 Tax=Trichonephila clavipes TaxID=2585209 RepID=A0A8X6WC62_TRICX|nr:hypothetical protein TNCV_4693951 [Trichonephila clavipes]
MMSSVNTPNFTPGGGVFSMPAKSSEKSVGLRTEPCGTPCPSTTGSEKAVLVNAMGLKSLGVKVFFPAFFIRIIVDLFQSAGRHPVFQDRLAKSIRHCLPSWKRFSSIWPKMPSGPGDLVRSNSAIASRSSVDVKAMDSS